MSRDFVSEDDSQLRRPDDELLDDPYVAQDPDADQRAVPETPAADDAEPGRRLSERFANERRPDNDQHFGGGFGGDPGRSRT